MTRRLTWLLVAAVRLAPAQSAPCATVEGERLEARHLGALVPAFLALPPETSVAAAPTPGARRIFREPELRSLAKRFSLPLETAPDICFEWELRPLDRSLALAAMRAALPLPELAIEITETSLYGVPRGPVEFRREGLGNPGNPAVATPVMWHGSVLYAENRRFSVWARVVVSAKLPRVIAAAPLKRGEPIRADQLRLEMVAGFPVRGDLAETLEEVAGKAAWRDIPAASQIRLAQLTRPPDVARGDMIDVEVHAGNARLVLTAKAESAGRSGDLITIRNPTSDRVFQARVSGKGKAVVEMERNHAN